MIAVAPPHRPASTTLTTARTATELARLEAAWRRLQSLDPNATIFSSWQWNLAAARHFIDGGDLRVTLVRDETGAPIALAPLAKRCILGLRALVWLGSCGFDYSRADYQDLLVAPGAEDEAVEALVGALASDNDWDLLRLQELPASSPLLDRLPALARAHGWRVAVEPGSDVYHVELPRTWEAYTQRLSPSMRASVGRKTRKVIRDHDAVFHRVETSFELPDALESLFALHEERWHGDGRRHLFGKPTIFPDARTRAFHRDLASSLLDDGLLDLERLQAGGETVGARYSFELNGTRSFYASGYRLDDEWSKCSLGLVMDAHSLEDAIERGLRREDFLRNDGAYKQHYDPTRSDNKQLLVFRTAAAERRFRAYESIRALGRKLVSRWR